jgi:small subunit ribosomal protein S17
MPRRILKGTVVSNAADKTVSVEVQRRIMHPLYKKYVRKSSKYIAHDENNEYTVGDTVEIQEVKPISKRKRWAVIGQPDEDTA